MTYLRSIKTAWIRLTRISFAAMAALAFGLASSDSSLAQYPDKPVTIVVPLAPGSSVDVYARIFANKLRDKHGKPFVVMNRAGAEGRIGIQAAAKSAADGYTLLFSGNAPLSVVSALDDTLSWDPVRDFIPVAMIGTAPYVMAASSKLGVKSFPELLDHLKKNPGKLNASVGGPASRIGLEIFKIRTGTTFQSVPYNGDAPATLAVVSGDVDFGFMQPAVYAGQATSGRINLVAVAADKRIASLADSPTIKELGVNFTHELYFGFFAPAGTPRAIVDEINRDVLELLQSKELGEQLLASGLQPPQPLSPDAFAAKFHEDVKNTKESVVRAGLKTPQ